MLELKRTIYPIPYEPLSLRRECEKYLSVENVNMNKGVTVMQVSDSAKEKIVELMQKKNVNTLRIYFSGYG